MYTNCSNMKEIGWKNNDPCSIIQKWKHIITNEIQKSLNKCILLVLYQLIQNKIVIINHYKQSLVNT
jgi:hypothetical protein